VTIILLCCSVPPSCNRSVAANGMASVRMHRGEIISLAMRICVRLGSKQNVPNPMAVSLF